MIGILVLLASLQSAQASQVSGSNESLYYQLSDFSVAEIQPILGDESVLPPGFPEVQDNPLPPPGNSDDKNTLTIDEIVNTAKQVWTIINEGKPVCEIKTDHANAIPASVKMWSEMAGWQAPVAKSYRVTYRNGFGMNAIDFAFRVIFIPGGSLNGKGKYITNATIVPASVDVLWGYNFNAEVRVVSTTNAGTLKSPEAAMQLQLHWSINTPVKHTEMTNDFYLKGDGTLISYSDYPSAY